ncbi:hypothetical protein ACS0TY_029998 [Phlomoides rotata]
MSTWIASPAFKTDSDGGGSGDGGGGGVHDIDIPIGFVFYGIIAIFLMVVVLMIKLLCDTEGGGGERGRGRARESSRLLSSKEEDLFISYGTSIDDDEESRNGNCSSSSDDLYDGKICVICYDDQRTCFFIPCGHCITCFTCAKRIISEENKSCPICRTCINRAIIEDIVLFLAVVKKKWREIEGEAECRVEARNLDSEWILVRQKSKPSPLRTRIDRGSKVTRNNWINVGNPARGFVTFFFTNFLANCKTKQLFEKFSEIDTVRDIFVPNRLDKKGKTFGFVRFGGNNNMAKIEWDLNNIWFGSCKIRANISKFARKTVSNARKVIGVTSSDLGGRDTRWALRSENKSYL